MLRSRDWRRAHIARDLTGSLDMFRTAAVAFLSLSLSSLPVFADDHDDEGSIGTVKSAEGPQRSLSQPWRLVGGCEGPASS